MRIRWTKPAAADLTHICDYTKEHFGAQQAHSAGSAIYKAVNSLGRLAARGRKGRKPNTREINVPDLPFVIVYRMREQAIEVIRILHGSQRWP